MLIFCYLVKDPGFITWIISGTINLNPGAFSLFNTNIPNGSFSFTAPANIFSWPKCINPKAKWDQLARISINVEIVTFFVFCLWNGKMNYYNRDWDVKKCQVNYHWNCARFNDRGLLKRSTNHYWTAQRVFKGQFCFSFRWWSLIVDDLLLIPVGNIM